MPKVLIAEDDVLIADMIEYFLAKQGYEICGIASTVDGAVALGRIHKPNLAILDVRLANGGLGTEIADKLINDKLGILYATANSAEIILNGSIGHACLAKPYGAPELVRSVEIVIGMMAGAIATRPFPRGFQLLSLARRA